MKKIILIIFCVVFMISCGNKDEYVRYDELEYTSKISLRDKMLGKLLRLDQIDNLKINGDNIEFEKGWSKGTLKISKGSFHLQEFDSNNKLVIEIKGNYDKDGKFTKYNQITNFDRAKEVELDENGVVNLKENGKIVAKIDGLKKMHVENNYIREDDGLYAERTYKITDEYYIFKEPQFEISSKVYNNTYFDGKSENYSNNSYLGDSRYERANNNFSQDILETIDYLINRVVIDGDEDALLDYSSEELKLIRNAIFAKHGYIFNKKEYTDYFKSMSWYEPRSRNVNLTREEKELVEIIKTYE